MEHVDIDQLRTWIGKEREVADLLTPRLAAGLNAVFDVEGTIAHGDPAPLGIHWCLAPDIAPMKELGPDGHPARGGFLPPVPFPRRMWAGGALTFSGDFRVGDEVRRRSRIEDVVMKTGRSGELVFVTVRHLYSTPRGLALDERQDIVYRKLESGSSAASGQVPTQRVAERVVRISNDPVLLFRYSAIAFNGHRIHYDQPYATQEEGYPGLVFHGPLQASYLLRFAKDAIAPDANLRGFTFRSVRPLFVGGTVTINGKSEPNGISLWFADQSGHDTMIATATLS